MCVELLKGLPPLTETIAEIDFQVFLRGAPKCLGRYRVKALMLAGSASAAKTYREGRSVRRRLDV